MTPSPPTPGGGTVDKDSIIASLLEETNKLRAEVSKLEEKIEHGEAFETTFAASKFTSRHLKFEEIPATGMPAKHVVRSIACFWSCLCGLMTPVQHYRPA